MQGNQQAPRVHERKDMRMWGCNDTNKHSEYMNLRTWGVRKRGCQQARRAHQPKDKRMWGYEVATISTPEPEDMRMQGLKWGQMNLRIWGCRDLSEGTWTWGYEDVSMRGYNQVHTSVRIWGCEDARIQAGAQEPKDMRRRGYKQVN